jgi:hypothetical protein
MKLNPLQREYKVLLFLYITFFAVMASIMAYDSNKKKGISVHFNSHSPDAAVTEAVTFNYRLNDVRVGTRKNNYRVVDYVYFVDNQQLKFSKALGGRGSDFDFFKQPRVCRLMYSKKDPKIHDLNLEYFPDSITNKALKTFFDSLTTVK